MWIAKLSFSPHVVTPKNCVIRLCFVDFLLTSLILILSVRCTPASCAEMHAHSTINNTAILVTDIRLLPSGCEVKGLLAGREILIQTSDGFTKRDGVGYGMEVAVGEVLDDGAVIRYVCDTRWDL